jgi:hypothetical protein
MWPFTKKPQPPIKPLWVYIGHERTAVDAAKSAHIYRVDYRRGLEDRSEVYHFHANTLDEKPTDKLIRFFQAEAKKLNGD